MVHVSGHGEGKDESVARIGQLLGDFVDKPDATIRVVVFRIRFQTGDKIAKRAKEWANNQFRAGEYNLLIKNCQHFARLCAINCEECGDTEIVKTFLIKSSLKMSIPLFILMLIP